jgi:REP element-mobilizing transposase RayT
VRTYRRRLPHIDAPGRPAFLTWSLSGSLPRERTFEREHVTSGEAFVACDRLLDTVRFGPFYLRETKIASIVQGQLRKVDADGICTLHAFVIMPNHVHLLCTPVVSIAELVRRVKGPTALLANGLLGQRGQKFWQEEYFDRIVRNDGEFGRIVRYIEWNPVKAGLVANPEQYRWSSAYREGERG